MSFDSLSNAAVARLETRVDSLETRQDKSESRFETLLWWIISTQLVIIGGLVTLAFKH